MRTTLRSRLVQTVVLAAAVAAGVPVIVVYVSLFARWQEMGIVLIATLASGVCAALIAWPFARLVARRAVRPLDELAETAGAFVAGEYHRRAPVRGPVEVRQVAKQFNRMAAEFESALAQLSAEEKRKTQFVSDVSHELRTPLTAIRGAAETLLDGGVDPEHQERFLTTIAHEAERLTRLANDLLALQRIEGATGELPFRRADLSEVSHRAVNMLEPLLEDRGVTVEIGGLAPIVLGETDRLQQVVANLVDNASRITGEGGHVRIRLSEEPGWAVLAVADNGPGIDPKDLAHLFDRFYRADSSRTRTSGGSGLGLAIVQAIVRSHGGQVEAENLEGGGACITVRLPALPA